MDFMTYDTVARLCMVASLLLFVTLFLAMLVYVFLIAKRDRLDEAQRSALDLGPDHKKTVRRA